MSFFFLRLNEKQICFQARSNTWSKTEISYTTDRANRLPIIDVAVRDVGTVGQEFAIEVGAVCFQSVAFENL